MGRQEAQGWDPAMTDGDLLAAVVAHYAGGLEGSDDALGWLAGHGIEAEVAAGSPQIPATTGDQALVALWASTGR